MIRAKDLTHQLTDIQGHLPSLISLFHARCPQCLLTEQVHTLSPHVSCEGIWLPLPLCGHPCVYGWSTCQKEEGAGDWMVSLNEPLFWGLNHVLSNRNKTCHPCVN